MNFSASERAPSITSSETSFAPPSTIVKPSFVPATTISISASSISLKVGLITYFPFKKPTRQAATGPWKGISEIQVAAEAAITARIS